MDELDFYRRICEATCQADLEALLGRSLDAAIALSGAEGGHVVLPGGPAPGAEARIRLSRGRTVDPAVSFGILARVFEGGRTVRLENALEAPEFQDLESVRRLHILSVLAAPIVHDRRTVAALYLSSTRVAGIFGRAAEEVVEAFARWIAPAVHASLAAEDVRRARDELLARLEAVAGFDGLAGAHPAFLRALAEAAAVAPTDVPVLVLGESGTGKELLAHAIHRKSLRARGPFVALNCGAIPPTLLESELFGHERGAFTGAVARAGKFAAADGGTIFLDEVGELAPSSQVHLLRVLQSGEIQRVGSDRFHHVDVRFVAATNRPLRQLVAEGRFREDVYYRLSGVTIEMPPLRARGEDALFLADHFVRRFATALGKPALPFSDAARGALAAYPFPGNVRELENVVRRALIFARGAAIGEEDLPAEVRVGRGPRAAQEGAARPTTRAALEEAKRAALADVERGFLEGVLALSHGNVAEAARLAEMNRSSLHELLRRHGLDPRGFRERKG